MTNLVWDANKKDVSKTVQTKACVWTAFVIAVRVTTVNSVVSHCVWMGVQDTGSVNCKQTKPQGVNVTKAIQVNCASSKTVMKHVSKMEAHVFKGIAYVHLTGRVSIALINIVIINVVTMEFAFITLHWIWKYVLAEMTRMDILVKLKNVKIIAMAMGCVKKCRIIIFIIICQKKFKIV